MALPRTPDLPAWDLVLPAMDALRCFGLAETEEVPLRVDPAGHIRGGVTGKVSAIPSRFLYFFCKLTLGNVRFRIRNMFSMIPPKEID